MAALEDILAFGQLMQYMTEEQRDVLAKNVHETTLLNKEKYAPSVLERRYTYIDVDGIELPKPIEVEKEELADINLDEEISLEDIA